VRAATRSFAERGFRGTSLDAVAAAAGVTRQGLLHYFPTKTHLLIAVLDQRDEDDREFAEDIDRQNRDDLGSGLLALLRRNQHEPQLARLFAVSAAESVHADHPAHGYFRRRYQRVRELMRVGIAQEQEQGRITREIDADTLAVAVLALFNGLNLHQLLEPTLDTTTALASVLNALSLHASTPETTASDRPTGD
jgi:AcrR family transcriptional regulator